MKSEKRRSTSRKGEYAVITALLSVYPLAIILSPDPEWVVWAGQMVVGVIDPAALAPSQPAGAGEALRTASSLGALGLLAAAVLLAAALGTHPGWLSRVAGHGVAGHDPGAQETGQKA